MNTVYPVGYALSGSESSVEQLMSQPNMRLIDTRYRPYSWRPAWRSDALRAKYGERYRMAGAYLGNVNYQSRGPIRLTDPSTGIRGLCQYLSEGYDLILLCGCAAYDDCHRKVIVEHLKEVMPGIEVVMPEQMNQIEVKS